MNCFKYIFSTLFFITTIALCDISSALEHHITSSDVYSNADLIARELDLIGNHFGITGAITPRVVDTNLKPRHVWQKTYEVLVKINILRNKHDLPVIAVNSIEPLKHIPPVLVYEQTERIITEVKILKFRLGINKTIKRNQKFSNRSPIDVFNKLNYVSNRLDTINGEAFAPAHVFAQVMRILDDVNLIIYTLNIADDTIPPGKKADSTPADSYETALALLKEIQRLQLPAAIDRIDFSSLRTDNIVPGDVFEMSIIVLAELQTIKAYLGLRHSFTPPAKYYERKVPGDVQQILGWALRRLKLIKSLD